MRKFTVWESALGAFLAVALALPCRAQDPPKQEDLEKRVRDLEKQVQELGAGKKEQEDDGATPDWLKRLTFGGRFELVARYRNPLGYASATSQDSDQFNVVERVRLNVDAKVTDTMRVFVELEDARYWGSEPNAIPGAPFTMFSHSLGNLRNVDMKKGYVQFDDCFGQDLRIQIGRFNMSEGSRRFL